MTTSTATAEAPSMPAPEPGSSFTHAVNDSMTLAWRYLLAYLRLPQLLVFSTVQPIMFVLLFTFVFGGAISTGPIPYVDYLMPGIFVQSTLFGATGTGVGLADDLTTGLIERFRSLPMARSAVLIGRTMADLVRNVFVLILMTVVGFAVGFRIHGSVAEFAVALLLVLLFAYTMSWIAAFVGLRAANGETAQAMMFPILFPLVFASSAFVPVETMPDWLQTVAEHQPVTQVVNATRALTLGLDAGGYVWRSIAWCIALIAVFAPLAVRTYRRRVS